MGFSHPTNGISVFLYYSGAFVNEAGLRRKLQPSEKYEHDQEEFTAEKHNLDLQCLP